MKHTLVKTAAALTFSLFAMGASLPAQAEDKSFADRIAMAYAPVEKDTHQGAFDQFDLHSDYEDAHELNDAWLGMPVRDAAGEVIGYVDDAFLDDDGYLSELLVSIKGSGVSVYVDQKHVEYTEVAVLVALPLQTIASLEQVKTVSVE